MKEYDFIIAGSNLPALISAEILSKKGKVLILEEDKYIRHKSDSFIIKRDLLIDKKYVEKEFKEIELITETDREVIKTNIARIDEYKLRKWLVKDLTNKNVEIKTGVKILKVGRNKILTSIGELRFKFLVSTDNNRTINKHLNVKEEFLNELIVHVKRKERNVKLYLMKSKEGWPNFIWVLPYKKTTKITFGFNNYNDKEKIERYASIFLENNFPGQIINGRIIRIRKNFSGYKRGNIITIADSAGTACNATGEKNYYFIRDSELILDIIKGVVDERTTRDKKLCELLSKNLKLRRVTYDDLMNLKTIFSMY